LAGAAIGQGAGSVGVSIMAGGEKTSEAADVADVLADDVSASEPHAESVMTNDAAQAASATEWETRDEFTFRHATARDEAPADKPSRRGVRPT
jgi:hypothetical protein